MFIAYNDKKEIVSIDDASLNQKYHCPICGQDLIIKAKASEIHTHFEKLYCSFQVRLQSNWHKKRRKTYLSKFRRYFRFLFFLQLS